MHWIGTMPHEIAHKNSHKQLKEKTLNFTIRVFHKIGK